MTTEKLKQYFERARTFKQEIADKREDLSQLFKDAKAENIDTVVLKRILREDSMDSLKLAEHEHVYHQYKLDLGMTVE